MDPSQYKNYILTLLFVKYVSDKSTLLDVPQGASFNDMIALKGDKEIGDKINKIIAKLAEENDLKGIIDQADFNDITPRGPELHRLLKGDMGQLVNRPKDDGSACRRCRSRLWPPKAA